MKWFTSVGNFCIALGVVSLGTVIFLAGDKVALATGQPPPPNPCDACINACYATPPATNACVCACQPTPCTSITLPCNSTIGPSCSGACPAGTPPCGTGCAASGACPVSSCNCSCGSTGTACMCS